MINVYISEITNIKRDKNVYVKSKQIFSLGVRKTPR
jgi:hypothetical protein